MPAQARGAALGRRARLSLAAACGGGLTLAQPPLSLWPLVLAALPLLVWLIGRAPGAAAAGWTGFAAGAAFFATGLYWITEAFLVDIARHGWMAPFALLFMASGLALFWVPAFWFSAWLLRAGFATHPAALAVVFAALLSLMEFARTHLLTGFPWALPAYAWVETPLAQLAALGGPHLLGFVTLAAAGSIAALPRRGIGRLCGVAGLVALAVGWAWGAARLSPPSATRDDGFVVRVVQPNAAQHEKWQPALFATFLDRQLAATAAPLSPPVAAQTARAGRPDRPDAVIWPETAVPWFIDAEAGLRARIADAAGTASVIMGARRTADGAWFNALFVIGPDGALRAQYDKHHLVPFGEYIPLHDVFANLGLESLTGGRFTPGMGPAVLTAAGLPALLPLICYEAIFPHQMQAESRPDWLVQITNDAWFGSSAGPYQHFAQARMRAIEQGLPLVRAANTGISAIVDPKGRVLARVPLLAQGHAEAVLSAPMPPTLYARTGDGIWIGLILLSCVTAVTVPKRNKSPQRSEPFIKT